MEGFIAGAWREFNRAEIYIGGQWRRLTRAEGYIGGQWRSLATFIQPLTVSISPSQVQGFANPFKPTTQTITTSTAIATPSGGLGPYTYLWSAGNSPTLASNSFTATLPGDSELTQNPSVTVTDALGSTANASVEAYFLNQSQTG
jgi:hypothetical protein